MIMENSSYQRMVLPISVLFLSACSCSPPDSTTSSGRAASLRTITATAPTVVRNYSFHEKRLFINDMEAELTAISHDFDRLFPMVRKSDRLVQAEVVPAIDALRGLSATLYHQLEEAETTDESGWHALTTSFSNGLGELKVGLERSRRKITGSPPN